MKLTAVGSGYYRVFKDGVEYSKHTSEREAFESAFNLESANPAAVVTYKHDYEVRVESTAAPTPAPGPVPTPVPSPAGDQLFAPDSFVNKPLPANAKLRSDSAALVDYLVKASTPKDQGGVAVYWPNIAFNSYSVPIFVVTDASLPKQKVTVVDIGGAPGSKDFTEIHKQLQAEGFRLPADLAGAEGTDGSGVVWDKTEDSMFEFWQYRKEGGVHKISWGAILKNVSKHPGYIAALPNGEKQGSRASGIALASCMARYEDIKKGKLPYAVGMALPNCALNTWVAPATRTDGWDNNPSIVKMGTLYRLPASYVVPAGTVPILKMFLEACRDHGVYILDTTGGSNLGFQIEDIRHLAPAGTADPAAWAWDQYKALFGNREAWDIMRPINKGGQMPYDQFQAVEFPIVAA